jgi:hypothetical protein
MRRFVVISGAIAVALGVTALIALGVNALGPGRPAAPEEQGFRPGIGPPPDKTQLVLQAPLTDEEIARAKRIALHDPATAGVVNKTDARVVNVILYGEANVRVGAIVTIEQAPTDFDGLLPQTNRTATDKASKMRGYGQTLVRFTYVGITRLRVLVDLNSNSVAGVGVDKATSSRIWADTFAPATNPQ